jgi:5-methylcytosine-specific restriction protein A
MALTQRQQLLKAVIEFCETQGSRSFSLENFQARVTPQLARKGNWATKTPEATVRRLFQELRDKDEVITFVDNQGLYTLRGAFLLPYETGASSNDYGRDGMEEMQRGISQFLNNPRATTEPEEYITETVRRRRDSGVIQRVKKRFPHECMVRKCDNRFTKPNGQPYIEAHHIIPISVGGLDIDWNIALVCAHHHRMAHFANETTKTDLRDYLLEAVEKRPRA